MKILKFGASSLDTTSDIKKVFDIIINEANSSETTVVVVSSLKGIFAQLIEMCRISSEGSKNYYDLLSEIEKIHFNIAKEFISVRHQSKVIANMRVMLNELDELLYGINIIGEYSPRVANYVMSFGVRLASYLISECIASTGIATTLIDSRLLIQAKDENGLNTEVDFEKTNQAISNYFSNKKGLFLISGGLANNQLNDTTSIGYAGTTYTASILAAALNADVLQIWTDRDGLKNTDPEIVKSAYTIDKLTYSEAAEMAYFDMKIIYPPSLQPVFRKKISVELKSYHLPSHKGTLIVSSDDTNKPIKAFSIIKDVSLLTIQGSGMVGVTGVASRVFTSLADAKINVILITQASSEHSISLAISTSSANKALEVLSKGFEKEINSFKIDSLKADQKLSIIGIIGEGMKRKPGVAGQIFTSLGNEQVNIIAIAQGSSEANISIVVQQDDLSKALNRLSVDFS